jgi:hypothetical protein
MGVAFTNLAETVPDERLRGDIQGMGARLMEKSAARMQQHREKSFPERPRFLRARFLCGLRREEARRSRGAQMRPPGQTMGDTCRATHVP